MAITLTNEFRETVASRLIEQRMNFDGSNAQFSRMHGMSAAIFTRLFNGERDNLLSPTKWLIIGQNLGITLDEREWATARTDVFDIIEEDIIFCKTFSKARICVDDCGIGKTYTARYLSRTLKNCFYVDASQGKTKMQFIKLLAKTVGADALGRFSDVKTRIKFHLQSLTRPILIIDEAGDLEYNAFLELKELWNATEGYCGWYMIGADGLRAKIERGISGKKVGYAEIFSRYSEKFTTIVPKDRVQRNQFYRKLITDTLNANNCPPDKIRKIVNQCLANDNVFIGGLRRAESLLILNSENED
ncbi:MAG: hypothetical protein A2W90_14485 [Bacteroidetes bacterium GWF2_42_66]|nr:MAG: hypothetical protein A2W92_15880 [Bacteroidetes bacterium GWA2_42_15]OFX99097.1 MAG: hypothetical protein A2W89_06775 [Bacteroidetes bacterium GWE2_42_39]OFY46734.1 MAG: hypothetical protein A2W90_14485 [Bacteroidetes bacterium GWF2_42_66]HAZ00681.1 hypothetical protein [Marinilabiliales bacterium]HBL73860.1 hypothetical protein [Prolixibacteraceae bacterium]